MVTIAYKESNGNRSMINYSNILVGRQTITNDDDDEDDDGDDTFVGFVPGSVQFLFLKRC